MFGRDVPHVERFGLIVNCRQHSVVGRDKILRVAGHQNRPPRRSHAGVYHHQVNRFRRKIFVRLAKRQRAIENIVGQNAVGNIHDVHFGIDVQNHTLQHSNQMVVRSVIRRQCDDRPRQGLLPWFSTPWMLQARSFRR